MDDMDERIRSLFEHNQDERSPSDVRKAVLKHRKNQLDGAFNEAYRNNEFADFEVTCVLGTALKTGVMSYLSETVPEVMQHVTGKENAGEPVKWLFGTDSRGEDFISELEAYAIMHSTKHPDHILNNPEAVRTSIEEAYGSMDAYKEDIISNLAQLDEGLKTIESIDIDTIVDTVVENVGGDEGLNPLPILVEGYAERLLQNDEVQRYCAKTDSVLSQAVNFSRDFLMAYADTRAAEARKYE